jgi:hypothetical protein
MSNGACAPERFANKSAVAEPALAFGMTAVIAWRSNWPAGTAIRRWPGSAWSWCRSADPERVEYVPDSACGSPVLWLPLYG